VPTVAVPVATAPAAAGWVDAGAAAPAAGWVDF